MLKRFSSFGITLAAIGFMALPAAARHHQGETPEPGHHGRTSRVKAQARPADDHGKNGGKDGVNDKSVKTQSTRGTDSARDKTETRGKDGIGHK